MGEQVGLRVVGGGMGSSAGGGFMVGGGVRGASEPDLEGLSADPGGGDCACACDRGRCAAAVPEGIGGVDGLEGDGNDATVSVQERTLVRTHLAASTNGAAPRVRSAPGGAGGAGRGGGRAADPCGAGDFAVRPTREVLAVRRLHHPFGAPAATPGAGGTSPPGGALGSLRGVTPR